MIYGFDINMAHFMKGYYIEYGMRILGMILLNEYILYELF